MASNYRLPLVPDSGGGFNLIPKIANYGIGTANNLFGPFADLGQDLGNMGSRAQYNTQQIPYNELQSPLSRLIYQANSGGTAKNLGVDTRPQEVISNVAGTAGIPLSWALLGKGKDIGASNNYVLKNMMKGVGKQALTGAQVGYATALSHFLQQNKQQPVANQLFGSAFQAAPYAAVGGITAGGLQGLKSLVSAFGKQYGYQKQFLDEPSQSAGTIKMKQPGQ